MESDPQNRVKEELVSGLAWKMGQLVKWCLLVLGIMDTPQKVHMLVRVSIQWLMRCSRSLLVRVYIFLNHTSLRLIIPVFGYVWGKLSVT